MQKSYDCPNCGKHLNSRTTLWRHKKKCVVEEHNNVPDSNHDNIIIEIEPTKDVDHYERLIKSLNVRRVALQDAMDLCRQLRESLECTRDLLSQNIV